jgi:hypothetical protein
MENQFERGFLWGCIFGGIVIGVVSMTLLPSGTEISSKNKIIPKYRLTTDGKTVDTLWIYKTK